MKTIKRSLYQIRGHIVIILFIYSFSSCRGQSNNKDSCIAHLKNARRNINSYYKNSEQALLFVALKEVEQSTQCTETRYGAIELKLSLLLILKKYKEGYIYTDSLSESDFKYKYKRQMWHNYFLALNYESNFDTT